jgi:hypothetical protein
MSKTNCFLFLQLIKLTILVAISFVLPISESVKVHLKTLQKAPEPNLSPKVYLISDSLCLSSFKGKSDKTLKI